MIKVVGRLLVQKLVREGFQNQDLNLNNLARLRRAMPWLAEVSIGHAFMADALWIGLEEAVKACEDAGYKITVPVTEFRPGVTISMIEDPDGNWVELVQMAG